MAGVKVKVRGIYSTALTKILLERGFTIIEPSPVIRERFGIERAREPEDALILDKGDKQGILVEGERESVNLVVAALRSVLPEAIYRPTSQPAPSLEAMETRSLTWAEFVKLGRQGFEIEFPANCKLVLDGLRAEVSPTLSGHHLLKIIDAGRVDAAEAGLGGLPGEGEALAKALKKELVYRHYQEGRAIFINHAKLNGASFKLRGRIREFYGSCGLRIERRFRGKGNYDGLGVPMEEGDWGLVEAEEGSWVCKRSYFSLGGELKGEVYNINTPIEFYPDMLYYIDLEVDVVRWPDGRTAVIDTEGLEEGLRQGFLTEELTSRALSLARDLEARLQGAQGR
ncbi:MAG TPA: DUF402 domain-containing protein [Dehalococcoidia bacterium]|nr:DUF402 domain-containing protein [Dehalococcoidia bacterium]